MKRFRILSVTLSLLVLVAMLFGCAGPKTIFPDDNLEAAIREALGKPVGEKIMIAELANLTTLSAPLSNITDLSGLEYCFNLTRLNLDENQINDISPLASLVNLTGLDLNWNQISDISPLASMTNLTWLYLDENQISDISPLASLTNLAWLYLDGNQISDISVLSSLTNLTGLRLSWNQISDISILLDNSGLGEGDEVYLEDNNLDLWEGSDDMENIKSLEHRGVVVHY